MKRNSHQDFVEFVAARMDRWRRSAFLLCDDWHVADDIVGVAVAKMFHRWSKIRRADNPEAFAQKMLTRTWLDERRRSWHRERPSEFLPEAEWSPKDTVDDRETLAALLRSLGPRQRAVLVLRFYLGYSVEETADILRISTGTVKSQSARGLAAARATAHATGQ